MKRAWSGRKEMIFLFVGMIPMMLSVVGDTLLSNEVIILLDLYWFGFHCITGWICAKKEEVGLSLSAVVLPLTAVLDLSTHL